MNQRNDNYSSLPSSVHVTAENCRLNEITVLDSSLHVLNRHKVIVDTVLFTIARLSCGV